jgi:hypothetical protein
MSMDPFEKKISEQPIREPLPEWRSQILRAARQSTPDETSENESLWAGILSWLWPNPMAYAALASIWVAIAFLKLSDPSAIQMNTASKRLSDTESVTIAANLHKRTMILESRGLRYD